MIIEINLKAKMYSCIALLVSWIELGLGISKKKRINITYFEALSFYLTYLSLSLFFSSLSLSFPFSLSLSVSLFLLPLSYFLPPSSRSTMRESVCFHALKGNRQRVPIRRRYTQIPRGFPAGWRSLDWQKLCFR